MGIICSEKRDLPAIFIQPVASWKEEKEKSVKSEKII